MNNGVAEDSAGRKTVWRLDRRSVLVASLAVAGTIINILVVVWITGLHGVEGLARWFIPFRVFLATLLVLGAALPFIAAAWILLRRTGPSTSRTALRRVLLIILAGLLALGIILPTGLYAGIRLCGAWDAGDKPPVLLLSDSIGRYGVPDLCLSFWTKAETVNTLAWGGEGLENTVEEAAGVKQHSFMLRDLEPGREYRYRLNGGEEVRFDTPPAEPDTLDFAVGSDLHFGGNGDRAAITRSILTQMGDPSHGYDYLFLLGDLVHLGYWDPSWKEFLEAYPSASPVIPLRTVMGNHDGIFTGYEKYFDYLYPDGMDNRSGSRLWQRIDVNGIHLIFLDLEWGTESYNEEEKAWFEEQLASIPPEDWTVVMQHTFYYVSDHFDDGTPYYVNVDTRDALVPLFERYDVDLVLSGHNHHLELLSRNGVTYAVTGGMGGQMTDVDDYRAGESVWVNDTDFGYLEVSLRGSEAELTFRDPGGEALHSAVIDK